MREDESLTCGSYVKDVFVHFLLNSYENPNLLGIYLFISEETEGPKV